VSEEKVSPRELNAFHSVFRKKVTSTEKVGADEEPASMPGGCCQRLAKAKLEKDTVMKYS
jgi:hypothetical protein